MGKDFHQPDQDRAMLEVPAWPVPRGQRFWPASPWCLGALVV